LNRLKGGPHGIGHRGGRDLLNLPFKVLRRRQGNEPAQYGKDSGEGTLFLLSDQVALAQDPNEIPYPTHDGDPIDTFLQKEPCGIGDFHLGQTLIISPVIMSLALTISSPLCY
jgi:hypothetical protein